MSTTLSNPQPSRAAVVLCGGRSRRMGIDKASLTFGGATMLQHVLKAVVPAVDQVVVVGQEDQRAQLQANLGEFSSAVSIAMDAVGDRGPLEGLRAGLRACEASMPVALAFACGCDMPLLSADIVRWMLDHIVDDAWAAAPQLEHKLAPLPAVFRLQVLPTVEHLLATGERSLQALLAAVPLTRFSLDALRLLDSDLNFLRSVNTPSDLAALAGIANP